MIIETQKQMIEFGIARRKQIPTIRHFWKRKIANSKNSTLPKNTRSRVIYRYIFGYAVCMIHV